MVWLARYGMNGVWWGRGSANWLVCGLGKMRQCRIWGFKVSTVRDLVQYDLTDVDLRGFEN